MLSGRDPGAYRAPANPKPTPQPTAVRLPWEGGGTPPPSGGQPNPAPAPTPGAAAPAPGAPSPYDFNTDPILQRILAYNLSIKQNAQAAADAARRQLAIQFGDASGVTGDEATAQAARDNPFSILANEQRAYERLGHQHDEALNQNNLFYSGARVQQLQDDATAHQQRLYDARQQELAQLGQIQNQLAAALGGADQSDIAARNDAYGRAQDRALQYGYDPGAGAAVGAPPAPHLTTPTAAAGAAAALSRPPSGSPLVNQLLPRVRQQLQPRPGVASFL